MLLFEIIIEKEDGCMSEYQENNLEVKVNNTEASVYSSDVTVSNLYEEATVEQPGFFKRLLWVFTSPGKLMASLAEKPRVLFWLIFGSLPVLLLYIIRMPLLTDMLRQAASAQSDIYEAYGLEMTPEMIEASLPTTIATSLIAAPLTTFAGFFLTALIFFAIFKLMSGQGKYKAYLSVVVHASIISALYILLLIPISHFTGKLHMDVPLTSLASLAPLDMAGTPFYTFLANIDIFKIWYYIVLAIGFCAVSKLKKKHVYIVTGIIFLVGVIISVLSVTAASALV